MRREKVRCQFTICNPLYSAQILNNLANLTSGNSNHLCKANSCNEVEWKCVLCKFRLKFPHVSRFVTHSRKSLSLIKYYMFTLIINMGVLDGTSGTAADVPSVGLKRASVSFCNVGCGWERRKRENQAEYTAILVACGWAGPVISLCKPQNSKIRDRK